MTDSLSLSDTGYDFLLDENNYYDLEVNSNGDIDLTFGSDSIVQSLIRRSLTPKSGFSRYVYIGEGRWESIGVGFGSKLSFYLSQNDPDLEAIQEEVRRVLNRDGRINIQKVIVKNERPIKVDIQFQFRNSRIVQKESLTLG